MRHYFILTNQTDLTNSDSDSDGFHDGDEIFYGSNPLDDGDYPQIGGGTYFVNPENGSLGNCTYLLKLSDGTHSIYSLN